jgi:4-hydroxybenzoate polyprenyltransferase
MRFGAFKELTRLEQTFFGLPFTAGGLLLAYLEKGVQNGWALLWVLPAFLLARISGMAFNQLIDCHIDQRNPRTFNRPIPSGRITEKQARWVAWTALFLFLLVCFQINQITAILALFAASLLYIYSYTKRVHASCHFILGFIHFLGPVAAYAALTGTFSIASICLGCTAAASIIGNDIAYAIQDYDFDRRQGLYSIPCRFGIAKSLILSFLMHFFCPLFLLFLGLIFRLPLFFYAFLTPLIGYLYYFHFMLKKEWGIKQSIQGMEKLFFVCNIVVSFFSFFYILTFTLWILL